MLSRDPSRFGHRGSWPMAVSSPVSPRSGSTSMGGPSCWTSAIPMRARRMSSRRGRTMLAAGARPTGGARKSWIGPPSCVCWRASGAARIPSWSAPRLHLVDLQYSDVRLDKGPVPTDWSRGSMKRLVTEQQVLDAIDNPDRYRAYFRVSVCAASGADIAAASWDSVIFDPAASLCGYRHWSRCEAARPTSGSFSMLSTVLSNCGTTSPTKAPMRRTAGL